MADWESGGLEKWGGGRAAEPKHVCSEEQTAENTVPSVYWLLAFVGNGKICRFKRNLICKFTFPLKFFLKHDFMLFNLHEILQGFPIVHKRTVGSYIPLY